MKSTLLVAIALLLAAPAFAQAPQSAQVSLEYYLKRVEQTDMIAAQLMHERDQLKLQVQSLTNQLKTRADTDAKTEPKK